MIELDQRTFADFLRFRRSDLSRIVRQSLDRLEMCEVESEARLVAQVLSDRCDRALDFRDAADQDALLGRLYAQLVKWTGVSVRNHGRRDRSLDDEDRGPVLSNLLRAAHDTDPQIRQILLRKRIERCADLAGVQPTLFDGVDHIDPGFAPTRRMRAARAAGLGRPPSIGYSIASAQRGMRFAVDA